MNNRKKWTLLWLAVMLSMTAAFGQYRYGTVWFNDPFINMQNGVANLVVRVATVEQSLNEETQARKDLEKRVLALEKTTVKIPAKKSAPKQ